MRELTIAAVCHIISGTMSFALTTSSKKARYPVMQKLITTYHPQRAAWRQKEPNI